MTRDQHNARYGRKDRPTDRVPITGYNERCSACRDGKPHTWEQHDRAITRQGVPRTAYSEDCPACCRGYPHPWKRHDRALARRRSPSGQEAQP